MSKIETIMELLQALTLLEAAELVEKIEETFGVDASAGGGMMMMAATPGGADGGSAAEEKTEFNLFLAEVPADKKIAILKVVRGITGLGLKEAKEMVEAAPKVIQEAMAKDAAETAKKQLEEAGAKVELK
jgi:large subunit ribosomal protein L7/L12